MILWAALLLLDFASKWAATLMIPHVPIAAVGGVTFSLDYVINTGAAWGMFAGYAGWLVLLRAAIIAGLLIYGMKGWQMKLIVTGAIGNVIDYCLYGHVVDFFHFTFWGYEFPVFNVADSCITIGVLALFLFAPKPKAESVL